MRVVIMSGVSGSGKSTYIVNNFPDRLYPMWGQIPRADTNEQAVIVSADHYFQDPLVDSKYTFHASQLSLAHGKCFRKFILAMQSGAVNVVVDNTNTTSEEIAPYILGAQAFGYEPEIITFMCESEDDVKVAAGRNAHGVPFATVLRQYTNLRQRKLMPWWVNTIIPVTFE